VAHGQHVLVMDGLSETEDVLKAVFEPRGLQVRRVCGERNCESFDKSYSPSLVVIHSEELQCRLQQAERFNNVPRVIIGTADLPESHVRETGDHYLQQPFQYQELIQAIERLLDQADS
jgi:CheY-like chemotaxis protein